MFCTWHQLAVRDVLYRKNSSLVTVIAEIEAIESKSSDCDSEADDDNDIETDNEEDKITDDDVVLGFESVDNEINDQYLQKYVKLEFGKELNLQLDLITRWNSLLFMLQPTPITVLCPKSIN